MQFQTYTNETIENLPMVTEADHGFINTHSFYDLTDDEQAITTLLYAADIIGDSNFFYDWFGPICINSLQGGEPYLARTLNNLGLKISTFLNFSPLEIREFYSNNQVHIDSAAISLINTYAHLVATKTEYSAPSFFITKVLDYFAPLAEDRFDLVCGDMESHNFTFQGEI